MLREQKELIEPLVDKDKSLVESSQSYSQLSSVNASGSLFSNTASWSQNFVTTSKSLDQLGWHYNVDPAVPTWNNEAQAYTNETENVRIENGTGLIIEAHKKSYIYPNSLDALSYDYTSARIDTRNSFFFDYGRLEATIKLPQGKGVWPAFWLLSANQIHTDELSPTDADWAKPRFYLHDGELDIMEFYGHIPNVVEGTVHTYYTTSSGSLVLNDLDTAFHTYGVQLSPDKIVWTVDNKEYFSINRTSSDTDKWPFSGGNQLYVVLNLALGGTAGGTVDDSNAPWQMTIKDIKYYNYVGN